eukprot:TRINITY_DN2329_c0_g1_i1.p1 TRINITY_DN2329_c0_g1~~TRINITY_DN2329_c0_g1_i1.p1  ORF type:complete len:182 (-),score=49.85 TRINITY_DN2329_c0_g1_i1:152-697(-)
MSIGKRYSKTSPPHLIFPACIFYKELLERYPQAKVILTVRDVDSWYESCINTIYRVGKFKIWKVIGLVSPWTGRFINMAENLIWNQYFEGKFEDKKFAVEKFNKHVEEVKRVVPKDKLLVFEVKEGWEPLCKFLGKEIPKKPFPRVNDTAEFQKRILVMQIVSAAPFVILVLSILFGLLWR